MNLAKTNFSGKLPASIGNLGSLTTILIWGCNFSGFIPSSLGNLTRLNSLDLSYDTFKGRIPSSYGNLVQLSSLYLTSNEFTSPIPSELANLTQLTALNLGDNKFAGQIPSSIFNLTNLKFLSLSNNYFSGTVEFDKFVKLKKLTTLYLSNNQVSLLESEASANRTLQKFVGIGLSQYNLRKFPNFLANQNELELLNLQGNNIHGQVPEWVWNMSLGQHPILLPWTNLAILDLSSNNIQGSLPIPSPSTLQYHASHNSFIGNISELICNLSSLQVLELSENNLSGPLPQCLHSFGDSLVVLDIRRNKFEGSVPKTWANGSKLMIIDFSQNKFQGWLPRSLAKCIALKALDVSNNQFNDTFPSWLGNLSNLKILILRSNKFYGPIKIHSVNYELQIVDLSYNCFTGMLPAELFQNSNSSRFDRAYHLSFKYTHLLKRTSIIRFLNFSMSIVSQ
ncbi:receptor-like protein 47 [Quercus suber]|uniref:Receptor-like protein 47 n=1 Tax=Quercus suber TaxID=58331 RepID=A0AAW0M4W5_QUESU